MMSEFSSKRHLNTAVCLMHKDENKFLQEFVDHYFSLGFGNIVIYDNESKTKPVFTDKRIEIVTWKDQKTGKQHRAYDHLIRNNKNRFDWVLFVDTDEYLILRKHKHIKDLIHDYKDQTNCIVFNWLMYGSSHLDRIGKHTDLHLHSDPDFIDNSHVKSLANIRRIRSIHGIHNIQGKEAMNTIGERVDGELSDAITHKIAYIKHYFIRGRLDFEEKMIRGEGNSNTCKDRNFFDYIEQWCNVHDERTYTLQ